MQPPPVLGSREPTFSLVPPYVRSEGEAALAIAEIAGIHADPWQRDIIIDSMGVRADGKWASPTCELEVSRQNGKSAIFEIRALAGLFALGEWRIVYSAHTAETTDEVFERFASRIEDVPEFKAELAGGRSNGILRGNGKSSIRLRTGQKIKFRTRVTGGGRGLSGDTVFIDEDQDAKPAHISALAPTLIEKPNPQLWYMGSAGGQHSVVKGRLSHRAREERAPRLFFAGWSLNDLGLEPSPEVVDDPEIRARLNPALGHRHMTLEVLDQMKAELQEDFATECLGHSDYPRFGGDDWVIPSADWKECLDPDSTPVGQSVLVADGKPDGSWASIAMAGWRRDGARHVEVIARNRGDQWVISSLRRLVQDHPDVAAVAIDPKGPLSWVIPELEDLGVPVHIITAGDVVESFAWFRAAATAGSRLIDPDNPERGYGRPGVYHRGGSVLTGALAVAGVRKLMDRLAWKRMGEEDISALVAATFAAYLLGALARRKTPEPPPSPVLATPSATTRRMSSSDLKTMRF